MAGKTDAEIQANPHFHHWEYRGAPWQKRMRVGPRVPMYDPIIPVQAVVQKLLDDDLPHLPIAADDVVILQLADRFPQFAPPIHLQQVPVYQYLDKIGQIVGYKTYSHEDQ